MQNIQEGACHLGIFTNIFSSICGTGFLGIPDEQFNLGHWSFAFRIPSMAARKYTTDRIRTRKAIAKLIKLRDKIYRSSGTLVGAKLTKASERLQYLLLLLIYRGVDSSRLQAHRPGLPLTTRPFFKGQNNQKLCLSFCHSLVSHLTSFFCTIYCVEFQFFYWLFHHPNIHSVSNSCNISVGCFLASFLLACP